jgi:hypothetical protein
MKEESDFVTKEMIKAVVDSNRQGVLDFPKPQVTRVGHDSGMVPVLSTNTTTVMTGVKFSMDIHGGLDPIRIQSGSEPH